MMDELIQLFAGVNNMPKVEEMTRSTNHDIRANVKYVMILRLDFVARLLDNRRELTSSYN
jgi:hypothetical protein